MAAIGSLVFCQSCGNLLDSANGDDSVVLTCDVCGAKCKGMLKKSVTFFFPYIQELGDYGNTRHRGWSRFAPVEIKQLGYVTPTTTVQHSRDCLHAQPTAPRIIFTCCLTARILCDQRPGYSEDGSLENVSPLKSGNTQSHPVLKHGPSVQN